MLVDNLTNIDIKFKNVFRHVLLSIVIDRPFNNDMKQYT